MSGHQQSRMPELHSHPKASADMTGNRRNTSGHWHGFSLALASALLLASHSVGAEQIAVPRGAKLQIKGNVARISGGGTRSLAGTFSCDCSAGAGKCAVTSYPGGMACGPATGPGACASACTFVSTTTGLSGARSIRQ
jgi:hypothetical protein